MIVYDNGDRLQHTDSTGTEQTVATHADAVAFDWTDLPLAEGFEPYAANTLVQYTVLAGGVAQMRGMLKQTDGTSFGDDNATAAGYARFCLELPDELMSGDPNARWQRKTIGGEYGRIYLLEIESITGIMNVAWPIGGGGARWVDLSVTFAVKRPA